MMPLSGIYSLLEAPPTCHLYFICEGQPIVRKLAVELVLKEEELNKSVENAPGERT